MADLTTRGGTKLKKRSVERLAREAEQGYDLTKAKAERVHPGRPSLAEGESPRISYRVAHAVFEEAQARAKAEGRTLSEVARDALQRYLAS